MKTATIDSSLAYFASIAVVLGIVLPLVSVAVYVADPSLQISSGTAEATVGVGVILRAMAQRLFRAGATNVVRLTFGTMTRTVARTAVTRAVRIFIRSSAGSLAKEMAGDTQVPPRTSLSSVSFGLLGTAFSFWGVLLFKSPEVVEELQTALPLSFTFMIAAALIPLVCLCVACWLAARVFGTQTHFLTGIDGLLIQAYFTLSGSFLPMTTDFEFQGEQRSKSRSSLFALSVLLVICLVLRVVGIQLHSPQLIFVSAMFLTYLFVYAFPVKPLLGFHIWRHNKLLWLCMFAPILAAFIYAFPPSVAALL